MRYRRAMHARHSFPLLSTKPKFRIKHKDELAHIYLPVCVRARMTQETTANDIDFDKGTHTNITKVYLRIVLYEYIHSKRQIADTNKWMILLLQSGLKE